MRTKKANSTPAPDAARIERIVKRADRLLKGTEHRIRIVKCNRKLYLDVTYTDYRPIEEVRKNLLHIVGGVLPLTVIREYSDTFIKNALYELFSAGKDAILTVGPNGLDAVPIRVYVNNMLEVRCRV